MDTRFHKIAERMVIVKMRLEALVDEDQRNRTVDSEEFADALMKSFDAIKESPASE